FKKPPHRFEAGTPNIAGAIGLAAAMDYIDGIGRSAIFEHDSELARYAVDRLDELPGTRVFGPREERGALVGFVIDAAHPHDLTTFADQYGLAMRGGHHCNQPLMRLFACMATILPAATKFICRSNSMAMEDWRTSSSADAAARSARHRRH